MWPPALHLKIPRMGSGLRYRSNCDHHTAQECPEHTFCDRQGLGAHHPSQQGCGLCEYFSVQNPRAALGRVHYPSLDSLQAAGLFFFDLFGVFIREMVCHVVALFADMLTVGAYK